MAILQTMGRRLRLIRRSSPIETDRAPFGAALARQPAPWLEQLPARDLEPEIPHCCFYCVWCGSTILVSHDSLGLPFGGPMLRRIEARSIGTVCQNCSHAGGYSLFRGCQTFDTRYRLMPARTVGKTLLLDWLACTEPTCEFLLPFFLTISNGASAAKIRELAGQCIWNQLKCAIGHKVNAPRWARAQDPFPAPADLARAPVRRLS